METTQKTNKCCFVLKRNNRTIAQDIRGNRTRSRAQYGRPPPPASVLGTVRTERTGAEAQPSQAVTRGAPTRGGHPPWGRGGVPTALGWGCQKMLCCLPRLKDLHGEGVSQERRFLVPDPSDLPKDRTCGQPCPSAGTPAFSPPRPLSRPGAERSCPRSWRPGC